MIDAQLLIPMSGLGERFQRAGYDRPKPLIEIEGKPIIEHVLDMYPGWEDVVFIVNEDHLAVDSWHMEEILRKLRPSGKIVPIKKHKKGPAWAIKQAADFIAKDKPVVANYCDFTCRWDLSSFEQQLLSGLDGLIPTYTGFHPHMLRTTSFAYVKKDGDTVIDIQEKQPWTENPFGEEASSGTYAFGSGKILLEAIEEQINADHSLNGEYYLSLTYKSMLNSGMNVESFLIDHFMQWGTPEDVEDYKYWSELFSAVCQVELPPVNEDFAVILAAGEGNRFKRVGYTLPKPLIPISGAPMITQSVIATGSKNFIAISREDLEFSEELSPAVKELGGKLELLRNLTRGQAETAHFALRDSSAGNEGPVFVGACDAVLVPSKSPSTTTMNSNEIWVWTNSNYRPAVNDPESFGWVRVDPLGDVVNDVLVKDAPPDFIEWQSITGSFTFGSISEADALLENFLIEGERVNNEYYLDSLIGFALQNGWTVRAVNPKLFFSLGTPEEYETFRYWQRCFHLWAQHQYKFSKDPFIPSHLRRSLELQF